MLESLAHKTRYGIAALAAITTLSQPVDSYARPPRNPSQAVVSPPVTEACNLEALYLGAGQDQRTIKRLLGPHCANLKKNKKPDFEAALAALWDYKTDHRSARNPAAKQAERELVREYRRNPHKTTLKEYIKDADKTTSQVYDSLNWSKVREAYHLSAEKTKLLQKGLKTIRGKEIIAYGMTELFPSTDGKRNTKVLDYLLREAGATYLESLPAMYDKYSSFGMWQFTSFAICDSRDCLEGASKMSRALPAKYQIPGSVNKLRGDDHVAAAYLFAANNLALLISRLTPKQQKNLEKHLETTAKRKDDDLVQFIATAHHLPGIAIRNARSWLTEGTKKDFSAYSKRKLRQYATKTKNNYAALH
ncbi:hypothetical protein HYT55_01850 [Candidatus Woesearchaeota archaeon]|nr:hypothetical protein [Candidatus Woesearchaeota archaeon]